MSNSLFNYEWKLSDNYNVDGIKKHNLKVFGTFICGGGSSMGYKLAGYNHLGGVEIDPQMAKIYKANHNSKHLFLEDIRDFRKRDDIPKELFDLDILDGSPPCSSFSMAGSREKGWGKKKKFREGQSEQVLDDLFFEYIALAKKLQPKIVIAENVKGMLMGNARSYVKKIKREFEKAGYVVQLFLLNAASMGVPQRRERVFFVCKRKDLDFDKLELNFDCKPIPYGTIEEKNVKRECLSDSYVKRWDTTREGANPKTKTGNTFGFIYKAKRADPLCTIASHNTLCHPKESKLLTDLELKKAGSFPFDYDFLNTKPQYVIGMSVPPVVTAQVANQIYIQWLSRLEDTQ